MPADSPHDALLVQLAELHRARRTGRLVVTGVGRRMVLDVRQGLIAGLESEAETPGGGDGETSEPLLLDGLDLGLDPGIARAAARERLLDALTWTGASCAFSEGAPEGRDPPLQLSTGEVLREALPLVKDAGWIRAALGNLDHVLGLAFDPSKPRNMTLTPTEGYILSRVDGVLSAREVLQLIPLDPAETERGLFNLLLAGLVEYLPLPARRPSPTDDQAPPLELDLGLEKEPAPPPPPSPVSPPRPPEGRRSRLAPEQLEAARREIEDAYAAKVGSRNHFEVLELPRSSDAAAAKAAYFRLAKRFHPDARRDPGTDDLREKIKAVFVRLGQAYDVLGNARKRADFESSLPRTAGFSPPRASPGDARPSGPSSPADGRAAPLPEESPAAGESLLSRAEALMAKEAYWDAILLLEASLPTLTGKRLQKARLIFAQANAKNPKWRRRAEEFARLVVRDEPDNPEAYRVLASIYKAGGLESRAAAMYRKLLELRPDDPEAREALGPPSSPEAPTPLLKRLFRRS